MRMRLACKICRDIGWCQILFNIGMMLLCTSVTAPSRGQDVADSSPWQSETRNFEISDRRTPVEPGTVLFIGSSSIRLWTNLADDFDEIRVLNRGFGGSQIRDSIELADRIIIPYRPSRIVLYAGDNDLAAGRTPDQVRSDFEALVLRVRKVLPAVRIDFISIKPSIARQHLLETIREANRRVADFAAGVQGIGYIDVFSRMLNADGQPDAELFVEDGLHMNEKGYAIWREVIREHLKLQNSPISAQR